MKKIGMLLTALILCAALFASAAAETTQKTLTDLAKSLLTEVYGYTQAEADAFTFETEERSGVWTVRFYSNPAWVYQTDIGKDDLRMSDATTPFTTYSQYKAPENSVRYMLHAIADNGWFESWNEAGRTAFRETVEWCGDIRQNESMQRGLYAEDYTPAQALEDLFISSFGEEALWSQAVKEWRDAAFASFGLTVAFAYSIPQGIVTREVTEFNGVDTATICEFVGEAPAELAQAFAHPKLQGWQCLAGAYRVFNGTPKEETPQGKGLVAFANGQDRMLVALYLDGGTKQWSVQPIGAAALLPDRDLYITYNNRGGIYSIIYPISDTAQESFQCSLRTLGLPASGSLVCELLAYDRTDRAAGTDTVVKYVFENPKIANYMVTDTANGEMTVKQYWALAPTTLNYIDAFAFPKTAEACERAAQETRSVAPGYGIVSYVHLRAEPSSHAKDLGIYYNGTLVEVLETLPGTAFPWYHVRIGGEEGYMSSNYVSYTGSQQVSMRYLMPQMAMTDHDTALREGTGLFARKTETLPASTVVRVLGETGGWLHVSIPADPYDWLMQPDETIGYLKTSDVTQAATALQLEWLAAQ